MTERNQRILLRGATLVDWLPLRVEAGDLLVEGGRITARDGRLADPTLAEAGSSEPVESVDLDGRIVMPGWVIAHHHLYSALARGMPAPPEAPSNFLQILQRVWWVLDRCLDLEAVRDSALAGGLEALACGVTFIVDHHASPNAITGSLDTLAEALRELGLRSCLAYEVSDRDGPDRRDEGLAENAAFTGLADWSWPFPGGHASFTMDDETLAAFTPGGRIHVHLLEDPCDGQLSAARYGAEPVDRFDAAGLLGPGSLFAHGVHLSDAAFRRLAEAGAWLAYNPRSNANNAVGSRTIDRYLPIGCLGTDGMDSDLWTEIRFAFLKACEGGAENPMGALVTCLENNYRLARSLSGLPFGRLVPGAPADLMVLDYPTATPVTLDNFMGHLTYGLSRQHVESVMVDGRWRLRDRQVQSADADAILGAARQTAQRLWGRMEALWAKEGGHPYLG